MFELLAINPVAFALGPYRSPLVWNSNCTGHRACVHCCSKRNGETRDASGFFDGFTHLGSSHFNY